MASRSIRTWSVSGHRPRVVDQVVQLVDQFQYVQRTLLKGPSRHPGRCRARSACATCAGTQSSTEPPQAATSRTPLELTKLYCGDAGR